MSGDECNGALGDMSAERDLMGGKPDPALALKACAPVEIITTFDSRTRQHGQVFER